MKSESGDLGRRAILNRDRRVSWAAILSFLIGVGFSLGGVYALAYMVQYRALPIMFGIRASGGGFIESWGIDALIAAQTVLVVASFLELPVGYALWKSRRSGAFGAFALFPVMFFLGLGLLIPAILVIAPLQVVLVATSRGTLR